jgi:hypothetical protein
LRSEIEPVSARDFLRFLSLWQRISPATRMEGPDAVDEIVGQLEGFEAAAAAWEAEILPARIADYEPAWLDDRCLAGRLAWARLRPRNGRANGAEGRPGAVRTTPITLLARRHAAQWGSLSASESAIEPSFRAGAVLGTIRDNGASFFEELMHGSGLLRTQVEEALAELVALGLVVSDSFAGLRALLVPSAERKPIFGGPRRRRTATFGIENAGRWALAPRARPPRGLRSQGQGRTLSSTLPVFCCGATAWCSGACSTVKRIGCRLGVIFCASIAGSKVAEKSAADVSSPGFPASSSRSRRRSLSCERRGACRLQASGSRYPEPIRSTLSAWLRRGRGLPP